MRRNHSRRTRRPTSRRFSPYQRSIDHGSRIDDFSLLEPVLSLNETQKLQRTSNTSKWKLWYFAVPLIACLLVYKFYRSHKELREKYDKLVSGQDNVNDKSEKIHPQKQEQK